LARPRKGPLLKPHSRMYYARLILPNGKHVWRSLSTDSRSKAERLWPIVMEKLEIQHGVREGSLRQLREELVEAMRSGLAEEAGVIETAAELVGKVKGTSRWLSPHDTEWSHLHDAVATSLNTKDVSVVPMSWDEAIEAWRKRRERKKGDAPSIKSEHAMRNVANELRERSLLPNTLTENDVWAWIRELETQAPPIAPSTIRTKTSMLKALTKALATQKLINADPLGNFNYEVAATAGITWRSLSDEELRTLSSNLPTLSQEDQLFAETLLRTGLRLDELASRTWNDVEGQWLLIKPVIDADGNKVWQPKNTGSQRKVFLAKDLTKRLEALGTERIGQLFKSCKLGNDGKYGKNMSERIRSFMRKKCGLMDKDVVLHSFRNNYIDICRSVEMEIGVEMALVGHVDSNDKKINKVHRDYGSGYPDEVILKWSKKADTAMKNKLGTIQ
jgi:integrase